jgi:SAM-dependent methyltransferase
VNAARRSYDAVAERYAIEISDELSHKPIDQGLLDAVVALAGDGVVADVGAGPGHVSRHLIDRGAQVVTSDLSVAMCSTAQRSGLRPVFAADMTALPIRSHALSGLVCLYAVIHLSSDQRARAYQEFARVLRPGGVALLAFHTSDADIPVGGELRMTQWWGQDVELIFRYLDPAAETQALSAAGLALLARLDREPHPDVEHPSRRSYLLVQH